MMLRLHLLLFVLAAPPQAPPVRDRPPQAPPVVREVTTVRSFPVSGLHYNASHRCDICGRTQYRIAGPGPVPGTHIHRDSAGHEWYH